MYHKIKKSFYNCYFNTNCMMMVLGNFENNSSELLVNPECFIIMKKKNTHKNSL